MYDFCLLYLLNFKIFIDKTSNLNYNIKYMLCQSNKILYMESVRNIFSRIIGIGHFLPDCVLTNEMLEKMVDTNDEWITKRTGIKSRYINNDLETAEMGARSAKIALERANINPEDIDIIIGATITPDHKTPSMACVIQDKIGAKNAYCFDISAACSGMVYALDLADSLIRTNKGKNVLVVCAESLSRIVDYTDRGTCIIFGDGAFSAVVSSDENHGFIGSYLGSDGTGGKYIMAHNLPCESIYERGENERYFLTMNGSETFKFTMRVVPQAIEKVLQKANMDISEIDYIIPHQANVRIIEGIAKKFDVDYSKFGVNIHEVGNTSSASIGICLSQMYDDGKIKKGDKLLLLGFGAGLTYGAIIIEF